MENQNEAFGNDLINAKTLRSWLDITRQTQHRWIKEGKLKSYRIASKLFFKRSEVVSLIESNQGV